MRAPDSRAEPIQIPQGALLRLAGRHPERYPALLDSAAQGPLSGVTVLAALPRGSLRLDAQGRLSADGAVQCPAGKTTFLAALDELWCAARPQHACAASLPFSGGWILYLGYETALQIEPGLRAHWPQASLRDTRPVACALRIPAALIQDASGEGWLVSEPGVSEVEKAAIRTDLRAAAATDLPSIPHIHASEEDPARYIERVVRAQQYIAAGDIYQANLSRAWQADLPDDFNAAALYARLRHSNPAPFAALLQLGDFRVLSSSPERLLRMRDGRVDTRPIAGTYPRGATPAADRQLAAELVAHPKERAEHVMLIDLARNDLGRVCAGGSVRVDEYMAVETYAHVHHIVSNVTGMHRPGVSPGQVLQAVFPGGTITGCPKVRCMQIIAELEDAPRGPYTGSLGYLNHDGSGDFNILIRTMSLQGRRLELRAGAGIVADSDPARELAETRAKARGMLLALQP